MIWADKSTFERALDRNLRLRLVGVEPLFAESVHYSVFSGGKRIRPQLNSLISKSLGLSNFVEIQIGIALELVHAFSLVHDDLPEMDNDTWRRGKLTTQARYSPGIALLAGDLLQTIAVQELLQLSSALPAKNFQHIMDTFLNRMGTQGLIAGQALETVMIQKNTNFELSEIAKLKTGALFELAFILPALAKGHDFNDPIYKILSDIGLAYGVWFQAKDDADDHAQDLDTEKNAVHVRGATALELAVKNLQQAIDTGIQHESVRTTELESALMNIRPSLGQSLVP